LGLQERAGTGVQYRTRAPRDAMSCTLKSVGEVRPRRPSANHDPGPTPSAGVVLIPEPCPTAAPWQLRATRFDSRRCAGPCSSAGARPRSGAAPDAGSRARGTVPPERRGLHGAGQRVRRTPHCRRRNRNGVPLPQLASCSGLSGLVRHQVARRPRRVLGHSTGPGIESPFMRDQSVAPSDHKSKDASAPAGQGVSTARRPDGGPRGLFD